MIHTRCRRTAMTLSFLSGIALVGCSGPEAALTPEALVRDSAGVRMVENHGPDALLPIHESLRIGPREGELEFLFHQIRSMAIDTDGGIWVADAHESLRHYGRDGEYLGSAGGEGEGPGEARRGYLTVHAGRGTVLALTGDPALQLFSMDGSLLGSWRFLAESRVSYLPLGPNGDNWNLRIRDIPVSESELVQAQWTIGVGPATGPGFDTLVVLPGNLWASTQGGRSWGHPSFFYGASDICGDGSGKLYYSDPMEYRVSVYGSSGDLVQVISRDVPETPYTSGLRDAVEEGFRNAWNEQQLGGAPDRDHVGVK